MPGHANFTLGPKVWGIPEQHLSALPGPSLAQYTAGKYNIQKVTLQTR